MSKEIRIPARQESVGQPEEGRNPLTDYSRKLVRTTMR